MLRTLGLRLSAAGGKRGDRDADGGRGQEVPARVIHKPADGAARRVVAAAVLHVRRMTGGTHIVNNPIIEQGSVYPHTCTLSGECQDRVSAP